MYVGKYIILCNFIEVIYLIQIITIGNYEYFIIISVEDININKYLYWKYCNHF